LEEVKIISLTLHIIYDYQDRNAIGTAGKMIVPVF